MFLIFNYTTTTMRNLFTCLCAVAVIFYSCKQPSGKQQPAVLKIGVMSSMDFLPLAVAQEKGLFEKYGIEAEIQKFYSANDRDAAFQTGNIDGTVIDYTGAILQKAGGVDLKLTSACNATFCILTGPKSGISSMKDLQSKKIAVSRNTVIDFCVEKALQSAGLDESAIEKQEINKIPIRFEMLMSGQTDATALPDPFITIARNKGATSLICMSDLNYTVTGFVFKTEVISNKKSELQAFYKAYNEAVEIILKSAPADFQQILVKEIGFPENLINEVRLPAYTAARAPEDKDIQATIEWLKGKKLIPDDFTSSGLLDNTFTAR